MPLLTVDQLRAIMPRLPGADADVWAKKLGDACEMFDIDNPRRLAMFLAHVAHESGDLRSREENLNYSALRLTQVWPNRFPTLASARPYANNPEGLANKTYGGRMGNDQPGDGYRYRGRGPLQITGREGYRKAGQGINQPLEAQPDLALQIGVGSQASAWYWMVHGCNGFADRGDLRGATKAINGGVIGIEDRAARLAKANAVFGVT